MKIESKPSGSRPWQSDGRDRVGVRLSVRDITTVTNRRFSAIKISLIGAPALTMMYLHARFQISLTMRWAVRRTLELTSGIMTENSQRERPVCFRYESFPGYRRLEDSTTIDDSANRSFSDDRRNTSSYPVTLYSVLTSLVDIWGFYDVNITTANIAWFSGGQLPSQKNI